MISGLRKRLQRKHLNTSTKECEDDDKDELHSAFVPSLNYIKISQGRIHLVHQSKSLDCDAIETQNKQGKDILENRIADLEGALLRLQEKVNNSQCGSPAFEKELRDQLETMHRAVRSEEQKTMQTCRDHKVLQKRFTRQETLLQAMQQKNKILTSRIRQYEYCLDDVMRKVVDAIVAEDNLREEVALLKSRVRNLEEQNAALSASPAEGRDEGYCTMSSEQPQPSNGNLEDLPEEPEQWLLPAELCSTEMEDWSMSQEEIAVITLDDERDQQFHHHQQQRKSGANVVIWNSSDFLNSTMTETDSVADGISQLLQQKIVYSEDEEVPCTEFTNDFYKLVSVRSGSARSLYSYIEGETDDEDDDDDKEKDYSLSARKFRLRCHTRQNTRRDRIGQSPTPSEAGRAQVTSCSSSESDALSYCTRNQEIPEGGEMETNHAEQRDIEIENVQLDIEQRKLKEKQCVEEINKTELQKQQHQLVKSKSTLDEDEPSCILRNNQRREIESSVVRSGSVNGAFGMKGIKSQERLMQKLANSWRKSNGWKRVTSPDTMSTANASSKKETKYSVTKSSQIPSKMLRTRIPTATILQSQIYHATQHTSVTLQQQQLHQ